MPHRDIIGSLFDVKPGGGLDTAGEEQGESAPYNVARVNSSIQEVHVYFVSVGDNTRKRLTGINILRMHC